MRVLLSKSASGNRPNVIGLSWTNRALFCLVGTSCVLAYAVWSYGGVQIGDLRLCALALIVLGLCAALPRAAAALPARVTVPLFLFLLYLAFQITPLPHSWIVALSPAKAQITDATLSVVPSFQASTAIAINPAETVDHLLAVFAYLLTFLLIYQVTTVFVRQRQRWAVALPLLFIAVLQAIFGLAKCGAMGPDCPFPTGTYINRNHFAGLLEMAYPFCLAAIGHAVIRMRGRWTENVGAALGLSCIAGSALIVMAAIAFSLSRTAFFTTVLSTAIFAMPWIRRKAKSIGWPRTALIVGLVLVAGYAAVPRELLARFRTFENSASLGGDRLLMWTQSVRVIRAFPLFGCGFGNYASTYLGFKQDLPLWSTDFVHNDYLQAIAELGFVGFAILMTLVSQILVTRRVAPNVATNADSRLLSLSCYTALLAIAIHSLDDFNLWIPANGMEVSWICGLLLGIRLCA
jgi:O-antigen ligase